MPSSADTGQKVLWRQSARWSDELGEKLAAARVLIPAEFTHL